MADTEFSIEVQAEGIGTESTADEIVALSDRMSAAEKVITRFDGALDAAGVKLAEAAAASQKTGAALAEAEAKFSRLERAAASAGKKLEKASAAGKDTTKLQAAADAAAAAVREQAQAVDLARSEAEAAAAAHNKLARSYKTIERAAGKAAGATKQTDVSFGQLFQGASALGGPLGGLAGQISGIGDGLRGGGGKAGLILGAFAVGNAFINWTKAAIGLGLALVGATGALLGFAIASDKATSKKLAKAWEDAGKKAKRLFEGVNTDKLVAPAKSLLKLLDGSTSAGKGLQKLIETLLNPIIDGLVKAEPLAKEFFKGIILGALRGTIFILRLRNSIVKMIPKATREKIKEVVTELFSLANAGKLGTGFFKVLAVVAGAALIPIALIGAAFVAVGLAIYGMAKQIEDAIDIFTAIGPAMTEAWNWLNDVSSRISAWAGEMYDKASQAAKDFVAGLAEGIANGAGAIAKAATKLATSAISAIKSATQSASPSKLMIRFGRQDFAGGMAIGFRQGEPDVRRSASRLGKAGLEGVRQLPRPVGVTPMGGPQPGRNGATVQLSLASGAVVIQAPAGDAPSIAAEVRRVLLAEVEGAVIQLGAGEVAAGTT